MPGLFRYIAFAVLGLSGSARAATPPRYGGELRVLAPPGAFDGEKLDAAEARSPTELALARAFCEPLFRLGPDGALAPDLALLPEPDPHGRSLMLRLRSGLHTTGQLPVRARDVAQSLSRLAAAGSPYRALTLPLTGGAASARSDVDLAVLFDFPYPDWPLALSHVGTCPTAPGRRATAAGGATGPFTPETRLASPAVRLAGNGECPAGRPFVDRLALRSGNPRSAARALASGDADVALLPVPDGQADVPLTVATYLAVNPARPALAPVAGLVATSLDRAELVRIFVRGPAAPLYGLLAPSVEPHPVPPTAPRPGPPLATRVSGELLVEASEEARAVAERLQVKLHDLGIELKVAALPRAELESRLGAGNFDIALVSVPALPEPGLNLAQVLLLGEPAAQVRAELQAQGALPDRAARRERASARARELAPRLPVVPLYATGLPIAVRTSVHGLRFDPSGAPDLGALWLEESPPPAGAAVNRRNGHAGLAAGAGDLP